jgi:hypothetical protein
MVIAVKRGGSIPPLLTFKLCFCYNKGRENILPVSNLSKYSAKAAPQQKFEDS